MELELNQKPIIIAQDILPTDTELEVKQKLRYPFKLCNNVVLTIKEKDRSYTITAYKGFCYDGASVPFGLKKGDTRLLIPSLWHDILCTKKYLVGYDRNLSSRIFRELLIMCKFPKWKAQLYYLAVDNYQRFMKGWK